jgi:virginiamycin B lyase
MTTGIRLFALATALAALYKRERSTMRARDFLFSAATSIVVVLLPMGSHYSSAQAQTAPALAGQISSADEGPMEGVLVSAKKVGSTITVSVVSDSQGHYGFPASKLEPGHYALTIRAAGYDLDGPRGADVIAGQVATTDIKLRKARNPSTQLSDAEWLLSMPGTEDQKKLLLGCNSCHSLQRIVKSTHDSAEFLQVFNRMAGYYQGSIPIHPQRLVGTASRPIVQGPRAQAAANYLASINLSEGTTWDYPLKTLPRLTGRSTRVVITEYDLPRPTVEPHDVILDADGMVWYSNFGEQFLGKMDPKTGKVTEYAIPEIRNGFPTGALSLETDPSGNLWIGLMYQGGIAKFDRKTETLQLYPVPSEWQTDATQLGQVSPAHSDVDQKIWVKNSGGEDILRFNLVSGEYENIGIMTDAKGQTVNPYGMPTDNENNAYFLDFRTRNVGKYDTKTGKVAIYPTPTPNSHPRKGRVDSQDRMWFAEYFGNAIAMFDPKTEAITEWPLPTPWSAPYDVVLDRNGEAWAGSMWTDRVARLDPQTGRITEYPLPRETNIRRVFVDNSTSPVTFWTGSNHGASIVKVEPLD